MIVLEYLVPSTGKLYHHKMKLRQITGESDPDEMLSYLEKRHPLYFLQRKLSKPQIKNLLKKLIFRLGQMKPKRPAASTTDASKKPTTPGSKAGGPSEKSSSAVNESPNSNSIFTQNKKQHLKDLENKALEKENKGGLASLAGAPAFKTGSQLPSLSDDFPPVGGPEKKKAAVKFND